MSVLALNRISIVLGSIGLFVAGYLSLGHLLKISLPCGVSHGCDVVALHPSSYLTGNSVDGGIPVAYLGFAGYLALTLIAIFRGLKGPQNTRPMIVLGFLGSAVGTIYSGYLTYTALYVIHATCIWCLASATVMVLTTVVHAAMLQADPVENNPAEQRFDRIISGVSLIVAAIALVGGWKQLESSGSAIIGDSANIVNKGKIELVTANSHAFGPADAPITIVEFADLLCPACQQLFPNLEALVKRSNGKLRLVFHHFPLFMKEDHKMALPAATMAEIAGEQGKFFDFVHTIYSKQQSDLQTSEALMEVAKSIGLDPEVVSKRITDPKDKAIQRVTDDINLANSIKIQSTPSVFLVVEGRPVEPVAPSKIESRLKEEPYASLMKGGGAGN